MSFETVGGIYNPTTPHPLDDGSPEGPLVTLAKDAFAAVDAEAINAEVARIRARGLPQGYAITHLSLDLGSTVPVNGGAGTELIYRREGSVRQGRLDVSFGGAVFRDFAPGMRIKGRFGDFQAVRAARSATVGRAELVVLDHSEVSLYEPEEVQGLAHDPVNLLGVMGDPPTYVTVAEDTQPTGATPTGSFVMDGFSQIRLFISGTGLTTVTLVPWIMVAGTGSVWYEQGSQRVDVADSLATGYPTRVLTWDVIGTGSMFFEVRSLLPAGLTGLGQIVQGLR